MKKRKSLGQHFLKNAFYLNAVADAAEIKKGETVVEIGPGDGALTEVLIARGAKVTAIEKDARLIAPLRERFAGKNFKVIEANALDYNLKHKIYKLVGNIPYYITGALLKKFLSTKKQPSLLVFLMQKEVAERIAKDTKVLDTAKYAKIQQQIDEIGRMLGGWIKHFKGESESAPL